MKVLKEKDISLTEVRGILEKEGKGYRKRGEEVLYEQKKAIDHARKYSKLNLTQTRKLMEELSALELKLIPEQVVKISDLLPETVDDVRAIFAKERFRYGEDEIKQITDIVDKYR